MRHYYFLDRVIGHFDQALRSVVPNATPAQRPNPAQDSTAPLNINEARQVARLIRANHSSEIFAQALQNGQKLTAKITDLEPSSSTTQDHLVWYTQRLQELNSYPSILNPVWYGVSFGLGAMTALVNTQYATELVNATQRQIHLHIEQNITELPLQDERSYRILNQINLDGLEQHTNTMPIELPMPLQMTMNIMFQCMAKSGYYL